ncbi:hypothetical protein [Sulfitobacter sp. M13]
MKRPTISDPASDPELDELICDCIDMFLSTLPTEQANILQRVDVDGERPEDVAPSLGLSASAIADQLGCARQALKERFAEMSRICPEHGLAGCDCDLSNRAKL